MPQTGAMLSTAGRAPVATLTLALLLVGGFLLRLDGVRSAPLDFFPIRQYHGALVAQKLYLEGRPDLPQWKQRVLAAVDGEEALVEPPLLEAVAVVGYQLSGEEQLWIPRVVSALAWVIGGFLLYRLARRIAGQPGSLVAAAVFLFAPYAVLASRSFQPDPLMVVLIIASTLAAVRYDERPTRSRLGMAVAVAALPLLVKPGVSVPFVAAVFVALVVRRLGIRRAVTEPALWLFALAAVPMLAYYVYGAFVADFLTGQIQEKIKPSLLVERNFWYGWRRQGTFVLTYPRTLEPLAAIVVAASLSGALLARRGQARTLLIALWVGYLLLGLVFTFHIHTHHYYSLPVIPLVALSLGALLDAVLRRLSGDRLAGQVAVTAAVCLLAAVGVSIQLHPRLSSPEYDRTASVYERIGDAAGHPAKALYVDRHYGAPIAYHGEMAGRVLLTGYETEREAGAAVEKAERLARAGLASCVVVTDDSLLDQYREFAAALRERFLVRARGDGFVVFDLEQPKGTQETGACD